MASSKYVWALGARRIILPGMLERIYKILTKFNLDLLVLNDLNPTFLVPKSKVYSSAHAVFRELNRNLTGLGFQVLPLEAWKTEVTEKYDGTDWTVFGVALEFIADKKNLNAFFLSEPCATSSGSSNWIPRNFQIWTSWKKVVHSLPNFYSEDEKEFVIEKSVNYFFGGRGFNLINRRTQGIYNSKIFEAYREDFVHYGKLSPTFAYTVSKFPIFPLRLYSRLYAALRIIARKFIHQNSPLNPNTRQSKRISYV